MASKEIDRQLMLDYLQGNCTLTQLRQIREYLNNESYQESLDKFLLEEWQFINHSTRTGEMETSRQFEKFLSDHTPRTRILRLGSGRFARLTGIAAALILLFISVWLLYSRHPGRQSQNTAASWVVYKNAPGRTSRILLPDSSLICLATASTVRYMTDYNRTNRKVFLEGEAYFIVNHKGLQPFTVVTGDLNTVDIGTEFNIQYYPGKTAIVVEVAKGTVEVKSIRGQQEAHIAAVSQGHALLYDSQTAGSTLFSIPDTGMIGAWRKGILSFRKRPLKELTDELERYYGISIHYANPALGNILLTTLLNNNTLEDALEIVTVTAGVRYTRNGNIILLEEAGK